MRIIADTDRCIGSARCVMTDATVFDQSDEYTVVVRTEHVDGEQLGRAREAVLGCPSGALRIAED